MYRQLNLFPTRFAAVLGAALLLWDSAPAGAADLGGDCCADLEERVAELEQTAVRHPNRKIEMTLTGSTSTGILFWDDGDTSDAYVVMNENEGTTIAIEGEAEEINEGPWSVGFLIEIDIKSAGSSEVSQDDHDAVAEVAPGDQAIWVRHAAIGTLTWGETKGASDGSTEADLSRTEVASYVNVTDVGGGFALRRDSADPGDLIDLMYPAVRK